MDKYDTCWKKLGSDIVEYPYVNYTWGIFQEIAHAIVLEYSQGGAPYLPTRYLEGKNWGRNSLDEVDMSRGRG